MQLNEILEENSAKTISKKTNISEENVEALLQKDFDKLKKLKALGFISIIEREYKADLSQMKEEVLSHYGEYSYEDGVAMPIPKGGRKKGKSKWFLFFVLVLLGYATWYFFIQFEQKQLDEIIPYLEEKIEQISSASKNSDAKDTEK